MKRTFDLIASGLGLVMLGPLFLVLVIAIRLESKGPAIFQQTRVGKAQRPFTMYKFRSMITGADKVGPYFTAEGDPRITKIGRILRKTSLDELPQLINVFLGDMSLVGPRPDTPAQEANYSPEDWAERCRVRPGITGLSQAKLRSSATEEERLALDLAYVRNPSLTSDILILGQTAKQVLLRKGTN